MIRVAAIGDVHYDRFCLNRAQSPFETLAGRSDLLLIAGDLTQAGTLEEAQALASHLRGISIPIVSVLGNHDFHSDQQNQITETLRSVGVVMLERETVTLRIRGESVGIVGLKGFGGGFSGACITEFGEPEVKSFARHGRLQAEALRSGLKSLKADYRFVLTHFSPVEGTLLGERREVYPFLGSYMLGEAIDEFGADAAFHGHAHHGTERGETPGGVPVRNVAQPVIHHAYKIYNFEAGTSRLSNSKRS